MPHFEVDCSANITSTYDEAEIVQQVHNAANASGLFGEKNIQVRLKLVKHYSVGNEQVDFITIFANILEGRTVEQKADLSKTVVKHLSEQFPDVANIAINIRDIQKGTGFNNTNL